MNELKCPIVKDLLPSYIDGLAGEETKKAVEAHLQECEDCRQIYERMKDAENTAAESGEKKELRFLKKNRKRNHLVVLLAIIGAALAVALFLFLKFFLFGFENRGSVLYNNLNVQDNAMSVDLILSNSGMAFADLRVREVERGVINIAPKAVLVGVLKSSEKRLQFHAGHEITEIRLYDEVIYMKRGSSLYSETLSSLLIEDWRKWKEKDEFQKLISSSMPGNLGEFFATWEDAVEFIGFKPWNPLETADEFEKMNYVGTDVASPGDQISHAYVSWSGSENGALSYLSVESGYADGKTRIQLLFEPIRRWDRSGQIADESITLSDGTAAKLYSSAFERGKTLRLLFTRNKQYYTVSVTILKTDGGEEELKETMNKVIEVLNR